MKKHNTAYIIATWLGILMALASCKKPDFVDTLPPGQIGTITSYLANNFDMSLFSAAVQKAGLADSLNQSASAFTIWAPVNSAFNKEGIFNPADFDKWGTDSLKYFVRSHIMPGKLFFKDIPVASDNRYKNVNGTDLYVSRVAISYIPLIVDGVAVKPVGQLNGGIPTNFGVAQLNGVVYPLTSPLKTFKGTVQDFLNSRPDLSLLTAGIKKFGLWDNLKGNGPFTVIAPQDTAFAKYDLTQSSLATLNINRYDPVLFGAYFATPNHVYPLDVFQLVGQSDFFGLSTTVSDYSLVMSVVTNRTNGYSVLLAKGKVTPASAEQFLGPFEPGTQNRLGSVFLGEDRRTGIQIDTDHPSYGRYINYTCSNGVVHLLSQVVVMPSEVKK